MIRRNCTSLILIFPLLFNQHLIFNIVCHLNYNSPADMVAFIKVAIKLNMAVSKILLRFTQIRYLLPYNSETLMIPR